jgi:hypothetical protein
MYSFFNPNVMYVFVINFVGTCGKTRQLKAALMKSENCEKVLNVIGQSFQYYLVLFMNAR